MASLDELLAERPRYTTLQLTLRVRHDSARCAAALAAQGWSAYGGGASTGLHEGVVRVWHAPPRFRMEDAARVQVVDGVRQWLGGPAFAASWPLAEAHAVEIDEPAARFVLDGRDLRGIGGLQLVGDGSVLGRPAVEVRADLTAPDPDNAVLRGADALRVTIDAVLGIPLAVTTRWQGHTLYDVQVVELAVDAPIDDELLRYEPQPGAVVEHFDEPPG